MRVLLLAAAMLLGSMGCTTSDIGRRPTAQEIDTLEGIYGLSDGFRAHLYGLDSRLYVRIGAGPEKELRMLGPNRLGSTGGEVTIQLQPGWLDDDVEHIAVAYYRKPDAHPPLRFASGIRPGRGFLD